VKEWLGFRALAQQQADEERERALAKKAKTGKAGAGKKAAAQQQQEEEGSDESGDEEEGADAYEQDPALGDLLQFLLSLPYVDEAWGIQDLILVSL
jgi:hypothetical protein